MEKQINQQMDEKNENYNRDKYGRFLKGVKLTEEQKIKFREKLPRREKSKEWETGIGCYKKIYFQDLGKNPYYCEECKNIVDKKILVHHIDGNRKNNNPENLTGKCYKCHNNFHKFGINTRFKFGQKKLTSKGDMPKGFNYHPHLYFGEENTTKFNYVKPHKFTIDRRTTE